MPILALVVYVIAAFAAMGLRALVRARNTGDSGIRSAAGAGAAQLGRLLIAAAFMISLVGILANLGGMSPIPVLDRKWLGLAGLAIAGAGIVAIVFSQFSMGDSWRMGVDRSENTKLVTTGPFRIVRNPIFAAMFVTLVGLSMMVPNAFALAGLLVLLLAVEIQVRLVEEPYLREVHSAQYDEYAKRVGRFLPGIGRGS